MSSTALYYGDIGVGVFDYMEELRILRGLYKESPLFLVGSRASHSGWMVGLGGLRKMGWG